MLPVREVSIGFGEKLAPWLGARPSLEQRYLWARDKPG